MNEQIEKFIRKSNILFPGTDVVDCKIANIEKFAELIIQECVVIADEYVRGNHGGIQGSPTAKSKIGIEIKKHFGVEEREE